MTRSTSLSPQDTGLFAEQAAQIESCLDAHIPADRPVALLQFPLDGNVGNHMMWLLITDYLRKKRIPLAYAAHEWNFDVADMAKVIGNGTVLFLGGVTVSRLWPGHAEVKRIVAKACPDNRLVSLPSTMLFVDDDDRREAGAIFGNHRNVVMMARDPESAAAAKEIFPSSVSVVTVHDSTFMMPRQPRKLESARHDVIWLARDDKEGAGFSPPEDVRVFDWPVLNQKIMPVLTSRVGTRLRRSGAALAQIGNPIVSKSYRALSKRVLATGNHMLDEGRVLVTDRLHPHILAALRGQPCVLLPDRYGKNRAVWEYSSRDYSTIHWADTPEEAMALARRIAAAEY